MVLMAFPPNPTFRKHEAAIRNIGVMGLGAATDDQYQSAFVHLIPNTLFHRLDLQRDMGRMETTHRQISKHIPQSKDSQRVVRPHAVDLAFRVDTPDGLDFGGQGCGGWVV
jgi:hypothetical protein